MKKGEGEYRTEIPFEQLTLVVILSCSLLTEGNGLKIEVILDACWRRQLSEAIDIHPEQRVSIEYTCMKGPSASHADLQHMWPQAGEFQLPGTGRLASSVGPVVHHLAGADVCTCAWVVWSLGEDGWPSPIRLD